VELSKLGEKVHRSKSASTMKSKSEKITRLDSIANGLGIKQNGSSHDAVEDVDVPGTLMRVRFTLTSSRIQVQVNFSKTLIPKHLSRLDSIANGLGIKQNSSTIS
jgi:hypothetical protein